MCSLLPHYSIKCNRSGPLIYQEDKTFVYKVVSTNTAERAYNTTNFDELMNLCIINKGVVWWGNIALNEI